MIRTIFVYGTLKRHQCRSDQWPAEPQSVRTAWTRGSLFGRRDYPAMTAGTDCVQGELWSFHQDDMSRVLARLDHIEGANQPGNDDLYVRVVVEVEPSLGPAYAYHYLRDPLLDGFHRMVPSESGRVMWPAAKR